MNKLIEATFPEGHPVMVAGIRVIQSASLPEGILLFVRDGKSIGMIDNRKDRDERA